MTGMEVAVASGILKIAGDKLVSLLTSEFAAITGVKKDLFELQVIHGEIAGLLSTVRDLSMENDPRFGWVTTLKHVAYDVDDLLYEVHVEAEKHKIASGSGNHAIVDCLCAKPRSFLYRGKVAHKIKAIRVTLAAIAKQRSEMNAIGHNIPLSQSTPSRNRANVELSLLTNVEESQVSTRDQEKFSIISKLLESNEGEHDWIVSIVGLGGSGKTTLAKHICHENKIKEQFKDKIYWVHVSQEFDFKSLLGKVFEAITEKKSDLHTTQHMVNEISKMLTREKFLLVLDDAWHQNKEDWKEFMVLLKGRAPGSKFMLTTRDQKVAEAVNSWFTFELAFLPNAESWTFFLNNSGLKEKDLGPELIQLGKEIVNKCGGVPLAIKTLGGILSEQKAESTWRAINQNDLWNVGNTEARVFASLIMSYFHLKDHLKECFIFCSIFPKGYKITKTYLVEQWMANGFIKQMKGELPEVIGSENFDLLVKVGFLQDAGVDWFGDVVYKMHDLIHDLTQYILKSEVATSLPQNITKDCTQKSRYLSLTSCGKKDERIFFDKVRALCVLEANPSLDELLKKSCYLRSVVLRCAVDSSFPQFILKLVYLGYLEISNLTCTQLPGRISNCWNLQSLRFIFCKGFTELPQSIGKLKKLRTLELTWTDLESLPQSIGNCRDLQLLRIRRCDKFKEIPNTIGKNENLRVLEIVNCMNLQQLPSEAIVEFRNLETINLDGCTSLEDLPSIFSSRTLRTLNLSRTRLTKLPEWITMIDNLQCIKLEACHCLVELPRSIGNLKRLEILNLKNCSSLHWMPSGFAHLTRLKRLDLYIVGCGADDARISDLENLNMISGGMKLMNLPHLMDISDAEKACMKKKKYIRNLLLCWSGTAGEEESVSDPGVLDALEPPSEIERLKIKCYRGSRLPCWMSSQSDSSRLEISVLNQTSQPRFFCLIALTLSDMPNLKHARGILVLPSLKTLKLNSMPNLEELWTTTSGLGIGEEEVAEQYCFLVLSHLAILDCPKLILKPYFPPSLKSLEFESSSADLLPPSFNKPSFCSRAFSMAGHLKELRISSITSSASDRGFFLPFLTRLESLELSFFRERTELPESMRGLTSLKRLTIDCCYDLIALPEWLGELRSLEIISINHCPEMGNLPRSIEDLTSLTRLKIGWCDRMTQLPDVIQNLTSLEMLSLVACNALTELPEGIGKLSALQRLKILHCSALQSLPSSIQRLTSLVDLTIYGCPELARRYEKDVGDDWHLVSHIRNMDIS